MNPLLCVCVYVGKGGELVGVGPIITTVTVTCISSKLKKKICRAYNKSLIMHGIKRLYRLIPIKECYFSRYVTCKQYYLHN